MAALADAARQVLPDSPTAAAQHALIVGLLRRELKPHGDRSFRQYSARYNQAMEVMTQVIFFASACNDALGLQLCRPIVLTAESVQQAVKT